MMTYLKVTLTGILLGSVAFYLLIPKIPNRYTASGIFVISRSSDSSDTFFTYEGHYAEQTAVSYTNSFLAIIQSDEVKKTSLEELKGMATNQELKKLKRNVRVKKEGPRVVNLRVKAPNENEAKNTWEAVAQNALAMSTALALNTDSEIKVEKSKEAPVVTFSEIDRFAGTAFGAATGVVLGLFIYISFSYMRAKKK